MRENEIEPGEGYRLLEQEEFVMDCGDEILRSGEDWRAWLGGEASVKGCLKADNTIIAFRRKLESAPVAQPTNDQVSKEQKIWLDAWLTVAGSEKLAGMGWETSYADRCLADFKSRWPGGAK